MYWDGDTHSCLWGLYLLPYFCSDLSFLNPKCGKHTSKGRKRANCLLVMTGARHLCKYSQRSTESQHFSYPSSVHLLYLGVTQLLFSFQLIYEEAGFIFQCLTIL